MGCRYYDEIQYIAVVVNNFLPHCVFNFCNNRIESIRGSAILKVLKLVYEILKEMSLYSTADIINPSLPTKKNFLKIFSGPYKWIR